MYSSPASCYAEFRVRSGSVPLLHDDSDYPPERLVQAVWLHQRVRRDELRTLDGQTLRVLHPGFQNLEGGPDFQKALLQFGEAVPVNGDVEVDLRPGGWQDHRHHQNPSFAGVRLHVVWEAEKPAPHGLPTLALRRFLDAPIGDLGLWLGSDSPRELPPELRGKCCAPLARLTADQLQELLRQAAEVRLHSKASELRARARHAGWDQALWEKLFRGLGYKHNAWPMQCMGELRARWRADNPAPEVLHARLLGISGLLPAELPRAGAGTGAYVRSVWDAWWRERDGFADCLLPAGSWRLHGIRPANHPQRRLALAARWAARSEIPARLRRWAETDLPPSQWTGSLFEVLRVEDDPFWSWHWTLKSARLPRPQPLLGPARLTDLAINVVLPWLWARLEPGDTAERDHVGRRYFGWPAGEDNAVLRQARRRLLGASRLTGIFTTAAAQQGLMQIVRDFCDHTNSICDQCKLPDLAGPFSALTSPAAESLG